MNETRKTKAQLLKELAKAHARIAELEASEAKPGQMAGEELKRSKELLDNILNALDDPVFVKDEEHRWVILNDAYCKLIGCSREELVNKSDYDIFPRESADMHWEKDSLVLETGETDVNEEQVMWGGELRTALTKKSVYKDPVTREKYIVGTVRDISERKQTEETLRHFYTEAEKFVEERSAELQREIAERERLQQEVIEAQKRTLQELSTPVIPIMGHIIVMPLIGSIDTMRARDITRALLAGIREHRAKVVILDITGVPIVDSGVASHLNKTIHAAQLKGARTIVTGISDAVAETIVDLGIDWDNVETLSDLRTGLVVALKRLGIRLTQVS